VNVSAIQRPEETTTSRTPYVLRIDPLLFLAAIGLVVCSYVTLHGSGNGSLASRQLMYAGGGLVLAVVLSRFDYTILREYRYVFYGILIALNVIVFGFSSVNGATRWIPLPFFQLQPSEVGKVLLVVALSAFAVDRSRRHGERRVLALIMLLALVPAMIVIKQPDLGTGLVYIVIACVILLFLGIAWRYLAGLAALFLVAIVCVVAVAPAVGVQVLQPYQQQRLTTFINAPNPCPQKDATCYQLQQGLIAVGSGGKTGQGTVGATQARFQFLPEGQTDFIFAVIGETYGFAGAAVVLSLYALLIWRSLRIVTMSKNLFGTLIAGGVLAMLMFQVFVNIGMTIGIMPVTGVPLPLLSYGGSSVIVTFLAIGLLQSIHVQARIAQSGKARVLLV